MDDQRIAQLLWALTLLSSGVLLLLFNFELLTQFEPTAQYILSGGLVLAGGGFFAAFLSHRAHWWRLIPAWTLLALAVMVLLSLQPGIERSITAGVLFVGLALAFANIYLVQPTEHWWAIIPGGFMLVLGIVIGVSSSVIRLETLAAILFVGMGAVFFCLFFVAGRRRHWWALIPGTVLILFGIYVLVLERQEENTLLRWWPGLLVFAGLIAGWRAWHSQPSATKLSVNIAPHRRGPSEQTLPTTAGPVEPLGTYTEPAPGASIEVLPDPDDVGQDRSES